MASKRSDLRRRMHDGKKTYTDEGAAKAALTTWVAEEPRIGENPPEPYQCFFGQHWHLGHWSRQARLIRRRRAHNEYLLYERGVLALVR